MSVLFIGAGEDPFLSQMAGNFVAMGGNIAGLVCHDTPKPAFPLHAVPVLINARLLHRPEDIALAFGGCPPAALSRSILDALRDAEHEIFTLTDRYAYFPRPFHQTKLLYRELVRHIVGFLESRRDVDAIFFSTTPHSPADIVFFHAARHLGIPTLQVSRTLITNRILLLSTYHDTQEMTPRRDLHGNDLAACIGEDLLSLLEKQSPWIDLAVKRRLSAEQGETSLRPALRFLLRHFRFLLKRPYAQRMFTPFASCPPAMPHARLYLESVRQIFRARGLRRHYESLASSPDLEAPYVYLALHSQPERSTQPEGGYFEDQFLAADILSRTLPAGWKLYVKEHPRQTQVVPPDLRQTHARTAWDYDRIASLPNTVLVPQRVSGKRLIANARATATITGSAGWESLIHGKPALTFGAAWYQGCDSCHGVTSVAEARAALAAVQAATEDQVRTHVLQFVAGIKPHLIHATTLHILAKGNPEYDRMANNLACALLQRVQQVTAHNGLHEDRHTPS
ncbi:hypothetical protein DA2_2006 [Desulfovibrio sp. A2]|nr:hypothetical protein DA2_2006 [Desulfovibrio sp. A2]